MEKIMPVKTTPVNHRRLPAEWEAQDAVLLSWPHHNSDWAPTLHEVEPVFIEICKNISFYQKVLLVVPPEEALQGEEMASLSPKGTETKVQNILSKLEKVGADLSRIYTYSIPSNDTWARDFGPITIYEREINSADNESKIETPHLLNFSFNGWGLKFAANHDNQITARLYNGHYGSSPFKSLPFTTPGIILEGGSIESDGAGTLLTTSQCLLEANRNPHLSANEIEKILAEQLGAQQILWLENGYLAGDDTDSHIDTLARICPNNTIAYVSCDDPNDEHYTALSKMKNELKNFRTLKGEPFKLVPLPWPAPQYDLQGVRLPATYANFLIINGAVLVPTYQDKKNDQLAIESLAEIFPERQIIGIDSLPLIVQHGSLHCVTMQIPKGVLR